jgi:hypothetical protein
LKSLSFEDSQIDQFIPYSSPSVLFLQTKRLSNNLSVFNNKSANSVLSSNISQNVNNCSNLEKARGYIDLNQSIASNLVQIPAGTTHIFKTILIKINKTYFTF